MSGNSPPADNNQSANQAPALTQANVDTAVQTALTAERARTTGILTHAEASGRTALAHQCVATGLSVEDAGKLMAASPKAAPGNAFAAAMASQGNPKVDGIEGQHVEGEEPSPQAVAAGWDRAFGISKSK